MSSSLARLRAIAQGTATPRPEPTYHPVDADGLPLDPRDSAGPIDAARDVLGARMLESAHGACLVVEHVFEPDRSHGRVRVDACGEVRLDETIELLAGRALLEEPPTRTVYFDLETTGLSGGAGTVAFLAGVGEWTPDGFRTTQFLLPSFAAERALLHALNAYFGDSSLLVTYNGRTFDVPVMELRGEMHRVPQVVCDLPHLDLLHPARRLWRASDEGERSCRLKHLEESVLGVGRVGDVDGFEIPARYFDFVRRGAARGLEPVLLHNRLDLLSLAVLTAVAQQLVREGKVQPPAGATALGLGSLYERAGDHDAALACYRAAATDTCQAREVRRRAARAQARLLRRLRRYDEAVTAWQLVLSLGGRPQVLREAREALAIHHEHRGGALEEARRHAVAGMEQALGRAEREQFQRRLARVERKLARAATPLID